MTRSAELVPGVLVRDAVLDRVGEVREVRGRRVYLRPPAGGREWEADPEKLTVLGEAEALRVRVAVENRRSRSGDLR
ncbi:hypothetical protein [Streptomyces aidingensis]|uniref:Uncharacterized protein n=1 Tax=Streptomyces aidingensis TaxID=910347 RepID=A0A1I1JJH4_9ACTN|nr:hypothetical protein [Streptomyces aidingensis]SFC48626.1 hypothetical protein SAMN05421773_103439 [Streptomyces aidingensis]